MCLTHLRRKSRSAIARTWSTDRTPRLPARRRVSSAAARRRAGQFHLPRPRFHRLRAVECPLVTHNASEGIVLGARFPICPRWVRRFRAYCEKRKLVEKDQLSLADVIQSRLCGSQIQGDGESIAVHCEKRAMRFTRGPPRCLLSAAPLQPWPSGDVPPTLTPFLEEYCRYRRAHNGVAESTLDIKTDVFSYN
jgi:hypothetical protein